jgi:hypothetical protein
MKIGLVGTEFFHADRQPRQMWRFATFQELRPHLQGIAGGVEAPKLTTGCPTPLQDL